MMIAVKQGMLKKMQTQLPPPGAVQGTVYEQLNTARIIDLQANLEESRKNLLRKSLAKKA